MTTTIKSLMLPEKVMEFEFPGCDGLKFELAYLGREELNKLRKRSTKTEIDRKRGFTPTEKFDDDKFMILYVGKIIRGWSGFRFKYLPEFILADISGEDPEKFLPFSEENALLLMKNSQELDSWIAEVIGDLSNFTKSSSKESVEELETA